MRGVTLLVLVVAALALTGAGEAKWLSFHTAGVSVRYPSGWHATARRLTPVTYPPQVLAVASFPFPRASQTSGNGCGPAGTLAKMPINGALIFVIERGAIRSVLFPPRPKRLRLSGFARYECFGPSYVLRFHEAGRSFEIHIAVGPRAGRATRVTVLRILDSFSA
jgi:hypothetical protein